MIICDLPRLTREVSSRTDRFKSTAGLAGGAVVATRDYSRRENRLLDGEMGALHRILMNW